MGRKKRDDEFNLTPAEKNKRAKEEIRKIFLKEPKVSGKNESQRKLIKSIKDNEITICTGVAGSGKTYVSLAYALSLLYKQTNKFNTIYLVKSVTTLKNEEMGFLRGDLREKFEPYIMSFKINMEKVLDKGEMSDLFMSDIVRPFPLAYIKGSSLDNCIILADEMQNVSIDNARILLTRIGSNARLVVMGDTNQIDLKDKSQSCLQPLLDMFNDVDEIGTVQMDDADDNCRNPLIKIIESKFQEFLNEVTIDDLKKLHKDYTGNGTRKEVIRG